MTDPFLIHGPALISFSGGRTSAYMLRRILDAGLQPDVHAVFANTGKERPETLEFVRECSERWSVPVRWVEWRPQPEKWAEVTYETASREGEPFRGLILKKQFLPNPVTRYCTSWLKLNPIWAFGKSLGYTHWSSVVGLRADEPRRVAKVHSRAESFEDPTTPLYEAGITLADIDRFWSGQPFDLALEPWEGNCDLCFLKGTHKRMRIMRDRPDLAGWWIDRERETAASFRAHTPDYSALLQLAQAPTLFDLDEDEDLADCVCGD